VTACGGVTRNGTDPDAGSSSNTGGRTASAGGRMSSGGAAAAGGRITSGNTGGFMEVAGNTSTGGTQVTTGTLYAVDYDQTCRLDDDCTLVEQGDQCCVGCLNQGAIARTVIDAWLGDRAHIGCIRSAMPCPDEPPDPRHCEQSHFTAVCASGRCKAHQNVIVDPDRYDKICTTVDDCVSVSAGEVCGCQCGGAAVSKAGYAQLQQDIDPGCEGTGATCPCISPGTISCSHRADGGTGQCAVIR
jgi:hypothetical protein